MGNKKIRLTKRNGSGVYINAEALPRDTCKGEFGFQFCQYASNCPQIAQRKCPVLKILDKLAYYEDLEAEGKLATGGANNE